MLRPPPTSTLFPYTTLFRSVKHVRRYVPDADGSVAWELTRQALASVANLAVVPLQDVLNRSEEHTSELQSRENLVCRLLLEKKHNSEHRRLMEEAFNIIAFA